MADNRLQNKIALITGAASGIGRATCIRFAEVGASIVAVDLNADGLNETLSLLKKSDGANHLSFCGDVTDAQFVKEMYRNSKEAYNAACNVLVNCAGIARMDAITDMETEIFDKIIRINLKSIFLMTKEFVSTLELDETRPLNVSIINISSILGKVPASFVSHYCTSKAGVIGFTQSIGTELVKYGIRCNSVLPSYIDTPLLAVLNEQQRNEIIERCPMKRLGKPREIANTCLFLASEESSFVNCANIEVTGGYVC